MAIKNVGSPTSNVGIGKTKDSEGAKGSVIPEIGNPISIAQTATNVGSANKNYGVELSDRARSRAVDQKKAFGNFCVRIVWLPLRRKLLQAHTR